MNFFFTCTFYNFKGILDTKNSNWVSGLQAIHINKKDYLCVSGDKFTLDFYQMLKDKDDNLQISNAYNQIFKPLFY